MNNSVFYFVYENTIFIMFPLKNLSHKEYRFSSDLNIIKVILEFVAHKVQTVLYKTF